MTGRPRRPAPRGDNPLTLLTLGALARVGASCCWYARSDIGGEGKGPKGRGGRPATKSGKGFWF